MSSIAKTLDLPTLQTDFSGKDLTVKTSKVSSQDRQKLKELSQEMEAVFLDLVMKSMRDTVPKGELLDGGNGEEIFRSMLDGEYAKTMSKQNMTGIAATIEKDLVKVMEIQASAKEKGDGLKAYAAQGLREK